MKRVSLSIMIASIFLLAGCATSKTAWEYYDECAVTNPKFVKMVECGKKSRMAACSVDKTCSARGNALVQYADSLIASVKSKELSEAEATRKWLEYRRDEENAYNADMNALLMQQAISAPTHTNCTNIGTYTSCTTY